MKVYLVNPEFPNIFRGFRHVADLGGIRYGMHNLALPTAAALTPADFEVEICDENIQPVDLDTDADFVGIAGFALQADRMFEPAAAFRERGTLVERRG